MHQCKKIKKRRIVFLAFLFLVLFSFLMIKKNYKIQYTVEEVLVIEQYDKKEKKYKFTFQKENQEFYVEFPNVYVPSKRLIQRVEVNNKEDTICILPSSSKLHLYPLCNKNGEYISYHLIKDEDLIPKAYEKEIEYMEKNYNNFKSYALNHKKYYLWNYEGFTVLSSKEEKQIKLFKKDVYNIPLTVQVGNYLLMADYDSQYEFSKFYVINMTNDKIRELTLSNPISFDSYFLGVTNKKAYLVDKKSKTEYEIYPKRLLIDKISSNHQGRILKDDVWEPIGMNRLVNTEMAFTNKDDSRFQLENQTLYQIEGNTKTRLSNNKVKEIVFDDNNTVYYLSDEKLYSYNNQEGEGLVLSNFEWNFNYKNMIYICKDE